VSRVARSIFVMRGRKGQRNAEDPVVRFMTVALHQIT
jgi:hypothetical protein